MKKISKKTREQAGYFCAVLGSFRSRPDDTDGPWFIVRDELGTSDEALLLAGAAFSAVRSVVTHDSNGISYSTCSECGHTRYVGSLYYAEAESLLRTGWVPE